MSDTLAALPIERTGSAIKSLGALIIDIGGIPIAIHSAHEAFLDLLHARYAGFISSKGNAQANLEVAILESPAAEANEVDDDLSVVLRDGMWHFRRGDFSAEWDPISRSGRVVQTCNPYSIDSILRILHSLLHVPMGGLLVHAASAIRNGQAFLFAGISGTGKTTIASLAPADATLLTDEISYLRRDESGYRAWGTPFTGELAKSGENVSAPLSVLYLLEQGSENRVVSLPKIDAVRHLLRHILLFAEDRRLVEDVFDSVRMLVDMVPVRQLIFRPEARVWEIIGSI